VALARSGSLVAGQPVQHVRGPAAEGDLSDLRPQGAPRERQPASAQLVGARDRAGEVDELADVDPPVGGAEHALDHRGPGATEAAQVHDRDA
jgi:hypothetical protein